MPYEIYIKEDILNEYNAISGGSAKVLIVPSIEVYEGFLKIGNYFVALSSVLYIKEVI